MRELWGPEPGNVGTRPRSRPYVPDGTMNSMTSTANMASMAIEYGRIGQKPGEHWRRPFDMSATEYITLLRRVPDGGGLPAYLAVVATDKATRLIRPPFTVRVL